MDAWQQYLENKQYKEAYEICKNYKQPNEHYIGNMYANNLFEKGHYEEAAVLYFDINKNFEEIFIKFIQQKKMEKDRKKINDGLE